MIYNHSKMYKDWFITIKIAEICLGNSFDPYLNYNPLFHTGRKHKSIHLYYFYSLHLHSECSWRIFKMWFNFFFAFIICLVSHKSLCIILLNVFYIDFPRPICHITRCARGSKIHFILFRSHCNFQIFWLNVSKIAEMTSHYPQTASRGSTICVFTEYSVESTSCGDGCLNNPQIQVLPENHMNGGREWKS